MRNMRKVKVKGFNGDLNGKDESDEIHHECFLVVDPRENRSTLMRKPLIPRSSTQRFCWYILHSLLTKKIPRAFVQTYCYCNDL